MHFDGKAGGKQVKNKEVGLYKSMYSFQDFVKYREAVGVLEDPQVQQWINQLKKPEKVEPEVDQSLDDFLRDRGITDPTSPWVDKQKVQQATQLYQQMQAKKKQMQDQQIRNDFRDKADVYSKQKSWGPHTGPEFDPRQKRADVTDPEGSWDKQMQHAWDTGPLRTGMKDVDPKLWLHTLDLFKQGWPVQAIAMELKLSPQQIAHIIGKAHNMKSSQVVKRVKQSDNKFPEFQWTIPPDHSKTMM